MNSRRGRAQRATERIRQTHGTAISDARHAAGLTATQLAEAITSLGLGCTHTAVSQWETGRASPRWIMSVGIAQALEVEWSSIFALDGETLK